MVFRPATPGFIVTLAATICLAVVSFSTPLLKPIYFLSATINHSGLQGTATFGVLGYCLETGGNKACSNATVGWEFDPNALLSLNLPLNLEVPEVVVKWLTYVLVLHIVALGLAAGSALFGLLAHVREMAMTCFSSCLSGVGAAVTLLAFIFDIVLFIVIRTRVRAVGGTASLGNGLWLTLAAWLLLFFAGFFFGIGRCCFASRPRAPKGGYDKGGYNGGYNNNNNGPNSTGGISHGEAMRLEAIKAENDRKARQQDEVGLPAFPTRSEAVPLKPNAQYYVEEDSEDEAKPYVPAGVGGPGPQRRGSTATTGTAYTSNMAGRGRQQVSQGQQQYPGGYVPGQPNARAVDQMYNPAPYRQGSTNSGYDHNQNPSSPPPMPSANQYLAPGAVGHGARQTSYHSAVSHQNDPSHYSQFDQPYGAPGGGPSNDPYYTQHNQAPQQSQYSAYPPAVAQQTFSDPYQQYNDPYQQPQQSHYAPAGAAAAAVATGAAYTDPYARTRTPPAQQQQGYQSHYQQSYNNVPPVPVPQNRSSVDYGRPRQSPTSPTGPRPMNTTAIPPWEQGQISGPTGTPVDIINNFSSTPAPALPPKDAPVPLEAPPSYDGALPPGALPPGAAPPGAWPKEKR